jgi:hypothetical protein
MRRTHLPIADPCHEDWDAMDRVERGRFCQQCDKQVFDLSSMTEPQAQRVLDEHRGGRICVRYGHEAQGNVKFRPSAPAKAVAVAALALAACTPHEPPHERVMGDISPVPAPHGETVEPDDGELMGKIAIEEPEPQPEPQPEPVVHQVKGELTAEPDPDTHFEMGDVEIAEPCDPPEPAPTPESTAGESAPKPTSGLVRL